MEDWQEDLEYDLRHRWGDVGEPQGLLPEKLWRALRSRLGQDFKPALVHLTSEEGEEIRFLLVSEEDEAFLVRFEPPSGTTTISFLGSLAGGEYTETVTYGDVGEEIVGAFSHERLGDSPIRVTFRPEANPRADMRAGPRRAKERTDSLLMRFRSWSAQPKPRQ